MLRNFQPVKVTWRSVCFLAAVSILIGWAVLAITDLVRQRGLSRQNADALNSGPLTIEPWLYRRYRPSSVEENQMLPLDGMAPFDVVAPPNPKTSWAVLAIVPDKQSSPQQAAELARYAGTRWQSPRWQGMTIYVFRDARSGLVFGKYQAARANQRLQPADYEKLTPLWSEALVCYTSIYKQGRESLLYPSKNPKGWWKKRYLTAPEDSIAQFRSN